MNRTAITTLAAMTVAAVALSQDGMDFSVPPVDPAEHQIAPAFDPSSVSMEAWMKTTTPGEEHKLLGKLVGDYDVVTKMWMNGAGNGQPTVSKGEASIKWILGGKHLREHFKGTMMGQPFEGSATTSYDIYAGQYVTHWVDSMSTTAGVMKGHASMDGGAIVQYGAMDEPMMNMRGKTIKAVTRKVDEDTHVFEMHDLHIGGDNTMVFEMTYTRKN